jgi:NitT/TauT family transport system substrate-binding protein
MIDSAAWDRTVKIAQEAKNLEGATVLSKVPSAAAYRNDIVTEALAILAGLGVDTTGESFVPATVTLTEGGN